MELTKLFDRYNLFVRVYPVLLLLLPTIITVLAFYPKFLNSGPVNLVISLALFSGFLYFLASLSRSLGNRLEKRLYKEWGGLPTTITLRHRDTKIPAITKQRYHQYFASQVPGLPAMPTEAQEQQDPAAADEVYSSAVSWLKEQRRDEKCFPTVISELIEYGFRRNLASLRWIGFVIYLISLFITWSALNIQHAGICQDTCIFKAVGHSFSASPYISGTVLLNLLALCGTFLLSDNWVREAGDNYARVLLQTCDA